MPDRSFFGEPKALGYLAFTEAWERFSYYGMTALLVLYMSEALFLPSRIGGVAGIALLRDALQNVFGQMSTLALSSQILGLYTAFVYFTPVLGGLIADRWLGRRVAVTLGAVLMSAGHLAMAFDASFLLALALLIVGCGLLKGNITSQVGALYADDDGEARTRAFSIFSMGINVGAVAGPLLCGLLAQVYGWHAGFALAGGLMLIGLGTYLLGYRHLPRDSRSVRTVIESKPLTLGEWRTVAALGVATTITVFPSIAFSQSTNLGLVWAQQSVDLTVLGFHTPVAWLASINPLASVVGVPLILLIRRWRVGHGMELDDIGKIAVGAWQAACANLLLVTACLLGGRAPLVFPVIYNITLGIAFLYYWPPLLALAARTAPMKIKATLMGAVFMSVFVGNALVGWIGAFSERMTPASFWLMHAAIAGAGGVLAMVLARPLKQMLDVRQTTADPVS